MKIICFSSNTSTWTFTFAEAVIAMELQKKGHEVVFITPGTLLKDISNLKQEKILRREFFLKGYELDTILSKADLNEINKIIKKLNSKNFDKLEINDIKVGRISLYEFLLHHKKMSIEFSDDEWKECLLRIRNTLVSFYACRKILDKEKPDRILLYSTLYSVNRVWERYAKNKGVPIYFLQNGANLSDIDNTLTIARNDSIYYIDRLKELWSKIKDVPVSQKPLEYATDNFLELLKAKHYLVYSAPKSKEDLNIRKIFGIGNNQRILTATLSSYDEVFAAKYVGVWNPPENTIFKDQIDWIKSLINYTKERQDLFLIIRVHPREFPNKRDGMKSEHAKMLEKVLENLPINVKVNWPTDNISIYDLAQVTNVFLNAWSSVGVEMSLLGIPVVVYSKDLILYPSDLNYLAANRKDYFAKIELALKKGWSYERIKKTYRWLAMYYYHTIVRLRNKGIETEKSMSNKLISVSMDLFYRLLSPKSRALLVKIYYMIPGLGVGRRQIDDCKRQLSKHVDISSLENMLQMSGDTLINTNKILESNITKNEEDSFIKCEIKRIYHALYGNLSTKKDIKKDDLQYNLKQVFM